MKITDHDNSIKSTDPYTEGGVEEKKTHRRVFSLRKQQSKLEDGAASQTSKASKPAENTNKTDYLSHEMIDLFKTQDSS